MEILANVDGCVRQIRLIPDAMKLLFRSGGSEGVSHGCRARLNSALSGLITTITSVPPVLSTIKHRAHSTSGVALLAYFVTAFRLFIGGLDSKNAARFDLRWVH